MRLSKTVLAAQLVTLAAVVGCQSPPFGWAKSDKHYFEPKVQFPDSSALNPTVEPPPVGGPSSIDTFTIRFRVLDGHKPARGAAGSNDSALAWQTATITTNPAKDADGLLESSIDRGGGRINDNSLLNPRADVSPDTFVVDDPIRLGPHKMSVRFHTTGDEQSSFMGSPPLAWSFTVTVDASYSEPQYRVEGHWSGAHAAELEINEVQVYRHGAESEQPSEVTHHRHDGGTGGRSMGGGGMDGGGMGGGGGGRGMGGGAANGGGLAAAMAGPGGGGRVQESSSVTSANIRAQGTLRDPASPR